MFITCFSDDAKRGFPREVPEYKMIRDTHVAELQLPRFSEAAGPGAHKRLAVTKK